jgi:VWFA-related protein
MPKLLTTLLALSLCASAVPLFAQSQPTPAPSPQITTAITVLNKDGKFVPNLTKNDFTLTDDGHPTAIASFTQASTDPLTMGFLVQTSSGQSASLGSERTAANVFLDHMIVPPQHRAFLIQFGGEVDLLSDVSTDKAHLQKAFAQVGTPQPHDTAADQSGNGGARLDSGGSTLYDAIYLASTEVMKKQPPRKVLIILSDGVDRGSKTSLFSAIEAAQRANTAVYAIYIKGEDEKEQRRNSAGYPGQRRGPGWPGGGYPGTGPGWPGGSGGGGRNPNPSRPTEGSRMDGRKILAQICRETGGYLYESGKKNSLDNIFSTLAGELKSQYMIGFTPTTKQEGGYHRIVITPKNSDLTIQARHGYYSGVETQ